MPAIHVQQRQYALSRIPQTNFATQTVIAANAFSELLVSDKNLADYQIQTKDNEGFSTRNDFPTEVYTLTHDVTINKEAQLSSDMIGRLLYLAFGAIATSQPDAAGNAALYRHIFTPQDPNTSRQLPATTFVEKLATGLDHLFPACVMEKLGLSGEGVDRARAAFTLRGSGKRTKPSGVNFTTHVNAATALKYFLNTQVGLVIGDTGTVLNGIDYGGTKRIESWGLDMENSLLADDGYRPGSTDFQTAGDTTSGAIRSELLFGGRRYLGRMRVRLDAASDEYAALQAQKQLNWRILLTGPLIGTAQVATPTAAPTLTQAGTGGTLGAGTYYVVFTYKNLIGETAKSPEQSIVISSGTTNKITVTAPALPANATGINAYVSTTSGVNQFAATASANTVDITALPASTAAAAPLLNTSGANHKLDIVANLTQYQTVKVGDQNGIVVLDIEPRPLLDVVANKILTVTLDNATASYTT